jgi:hypothetical protein
MRADRLPEPRGSRIIPGASYRDVRNGAVYPLAEWIRMAGTTLSVLGAIATPAQAESLIGDYVRGGVLVPVPAAMSVH